MRSIATSGLLFAALFAVGATAAATGSNSPPRFLTVPILGLRLPLDRINLEPFPEDLRAMCGQIEDNEVHTARVWVFGRAKDAASTYYVLSGYFKRRNPQPDQRLYELWNNGSVFTIRGAQCGGDDAAETFETHDPNADNNGNVPDPILRELAHDLAARTVRVFGGPDRLRAEIRSQRIDFNSLPQELQEAFGPYFDK
ncbi:hypothetical protein [Massilia endophytica]|uniref:hypothetical protein n=1 Tax=Massilia endophytica TaxID=2899220 RepID=UPI001E488F69|nr:hypothetical protein [Massilia endophytica]UGQ47310.1 hypothetical protein LSQ66_02180 [Massilia endophytica]